MYLPTEGELVKTIHIRLSVLEVSTNTITPISTQYNGLETPANTTLSMTAFIWKYLPFIKFDSGSVLLPTYLSAFSICFGNKIGVFL